MTQLTDKQIARTEELIATYKTREWLSKYDEDLVYQMAAALPQVLEDLKEWRDLAIERLNKLQAKGTS